MIGQETVNEFNTGGSHRVNPFRGIPIGGNNRAEEDETSVEFPEGKYIFSNRLFINNINDEFPMKLPEDISFAEASEYIGNQFREGSNKIDSETEMEILVALRNAQEVERVKRGVVNDVNEFSTGGGVEQVEKRMATANAVGDGFIAAGLGLQFVPVIGTALGAASAGIGGLIKGGTALVGNAKKKDAAEEEQDIAMNAVKQQTLSSGFSNNKLSAKVFPYGGYIQDPIPQDTTRTDSLPYLPAKQLQPIQDTTELEPFVLPRRDTLKELYAGGPVDNIIGTDSIINAFEPQTSTQVPFSGSPIGEPVSSTPAIGREARPVSESGSLLANGKNSNDKGVFGQFIDQVGVDGAIGEGVKLATGLSSNIAGLASNTREDAVPRYQIDNPRQPNKLYLDEIRRAIGRSSASARYAAANNSGGNFGQYASNVAAINSGSANALGQSYVQQQQINNQDSLATDTLNFRQRLFQSRHSMQADNLDAANEGAYQNQNNAYRDALFANVGSFGESLSNVGRGNKYLEELFKNAKLYGLTITPTSTT